MLVWRVDRSAHGFWYMVLSMVITTSELNIPHRMVD